MFPIVTEICCCLVSVRTWITTKRHVLTTHNICHEKGHKSLAITSGLFSWLTYISKMCYKKYTSSVIIIPARHSPKKKKKFIRCFSIHLLLLHVSQMLHSHDTKHPTEKFNGEKKIQFYSPKPTSTKWTGVIDTTCIMSLFFSAHNLVNRDQNFWSWNYAWKSSHCIYRA